MAMSRKASDYIQEAERIAHLKDGKLGLHNQLQKGMLYCLIDVAQTLRRIEAQGAGEQNG